MKVLVVDVGGTHVKLATGALERDATEPGASATVHFTKRQFASGPHMAAADAFAGIARLTADWEWDVMTVGYPGPVRHGKPVADPVNLAAGWAAFDFARAAGRPVRILNDAAMQALGNYRGGRMLFLGFGTGLGSALIVNGELAPLELAHLPYESGRSYEDVVGQRGLARLGEERWRAAVRDVIALFAAAMQVDDVVLGGGNANRLRAIAPPARLGDPDAAFRGGVMAWTDELVLAG